MSELRTNRIVPRDGLVSGANGGIIQVVHVNKKDVQNFTSTVPTFTDIAGLSLSITPTRSDSKILLSYNIYVSGNNTVAFFRILRGSTFIEQPTATPATNGRSGHSINYINSAVMQTSSATILDSPSTTSTLTYKIISSSHDGTNIKINSFTNASTDYYGVSSFTAMELSG